MPIGKFVTFRRIGTKWLDAPKRRDRRRARSFFGEDAAHLLRIASVVGSLALSAMPTAAMEYVNVDGMYTQAASGMRFPPAVGKFQRISILRYKDDGTDESAGYNLVNAGAEITATVYVFPSPHVFSFGSPPAVIESARTTLCQQQFEAVKQEISQAHPDASLVASGSTVLTQANSTHSGFKASYTLTNPSWFGRPNVRSNSDLYLFCFAGDKWTVEYRIDYPLDYDAQAEIDSLMRDLTWTIGPAA